MKVQRRHRDPGRSVIAPAHDAVAIVIKRLRQACYGVCGIGLTSVVGGSFLIELTPIAIVAAVSTALLCGACGLILEMLEAARNRERDHD